MNVQRSASDHLDKTQQWCLKLTAASAFLPSPSENQEYAADKPKFPGAATVWADAGVHVRRHRHRCSSSISQG